MNLFGKKVCFLRAGPTLPTQPTTRDHPTLPQNHTYGQYFQKKIMHMDKYQCLDVFYSDR